MAHMKTAALSEEDRRHLVALIESSGFEVTRLETIGYGHERNIGTTLVAEAAPITAVGMQ
jgi:hypothetical protein